MPQGVLAMTIVHGRESVRAPLAEGAKAAASAAGLVAVGMAAEAGPAAAEADPVVVEADPAAAEVDPVAGVDPVVAVAGEDRPGRSRIGPAPT